MRAVSKEETPDTNVKVCKSVNGGHRCKPTVIYETLLPTSQFRNQRFESSGPTTSGNELQTLGYSFKRSNINFSFKIPTPFFYKTLQIILIKYIKNIDKGQEKKKGQL